MVRGAVRIPRIFPENPVDTSQLPREQWHDYLGDPTVADAILDRLVHRAHTLKLKGPSKRPPETTSTAGT